MGKGDRPDNWSNEKRKTPGRREFPIDGLGEMVKGGMRSTRKKRSARVENVSAFAQGRDAQQSARRIRGEKGHSIDGEPRGKKGNP